MNNITNVIRELLFERDSVVIPGLGMFVRHYDGAKVNVITNHFKSPSTTLSFDPQQRGEDGVLVKALAAYEGCSEEEAQQALTRFVADCFTELKKGNDAELPGLGALYMDEHGVVCFDPEEDVNLNGDAFGLGDITPTPVYGSKPTAPTQKKAADDDHGDEIRYHRGRRRAALYAILSLLLVIPVVLALLYFLEVIHFDLPIKPKPQQPPRVYVQPDSALLAQMVDYRPLPVPVKDTIQLEEDTVALVADSVSVPSVKIDEPESNTSIGEPAATEKPEVTAKPEVATKPETATKPASTPKPAEVLKFNIIGGCFSQQENAEKLVASLHEQGFADAFVLPRGKMFYVSYGDYATLEEAKAALAEVKANSDNKAWILNK